MLETLQEIENSDSVANIMKSRNMVEVSGLASTAIRYGVSNRLAAAYATAYLGDLIIVGFSLLRLPV